MNDLRPDVKSFFFEAIDQRSPEESTLNPLVAVKAAITKPIHSNVVASEMSQSNPFQWTADGGVSRRAAADRRDVRSDGLFASIAGNQLA
jgi:hypothetical protein